MVEDKAVVEEVIKKLETKYANELGALQKLLAIPNLMSALSKRIPTSRRQDRR